MAKRTESSSLANTGSSSRQGLYTILIKRMDNWSIAMLSIPLISFIYAIVFGISPTHPHPFFNIIGPLTLPFLGTLYGSDLDNPRFVPILRSSTDEGDHGASRDHQLRVIEREKDRVDGTIVDVISKVESGATMDRASLEKVLEMAENDKFDVLPVMNIDRLTRAPVFEATSFYQKLKQRECILYADSIGYIDWEDPNDIQMLLNQTVFARKWYLRIQEGTAGSLISALEEGKYPYGGSPLGFETGEDNDIWVRDDERKFMYQAFNTYVHVENRQEALRRLNERRRNQGKEKISDTQLKTLLESRLCIGQLTYEDTIISRKPSLRVIDRETFRQAQEILRERRTNKDHADLPNFIARAIDRYGIEHILSILESFPKRCRKCSSKLNPNGRTSVLGYTLKSYKCQNDDCEHDGPLLTENEIQELHQTNPPRCPNCPATNHFDVEKVEGFDEYRYTCRVCGHRFKDPLPPNKFERMMESPAEGFDVDQKYPIQEGENTRKRAGGNQEANGEDDSANLKQDTLSRFTA